MTKRFFPFERSNPNPLASRNVHESLYPTIWHQGDPHYLSHDDSRRGHWTLNIEI